MPLVLHQCSGASLAGHDLLHHGLDDLMHQRGAALAWPGVCALVHHRACSVDGTKWR
jgi:hypothetical protein